MQTTAVPEAYNEILSERVNFPPDRLGGREGGKEEGREGAAESEQRVSE